MIDLNDLKIHLDNIYKMAQANMDNPEAMIFVNIEHLPYQQIFEPDIPSFVEGDRLITVGLSIPAYPKPIGTRIGKFENVVWVKYKDEEE